MKSRFPQRASLFSALTLLWLALFYLTGDRLGNDAHRHIHSSPLVHDYVTNALGHAYNLDVWLEEGKRTESYFCNNHPGLPVQLVSFLAWRAVADADSARGRLWEICEEPGPFLQFCRIFCAVLSLATVVFLCARLSPYYGLLFSLATALAAFTAPWTFQWSFLTLAEDLFALPLCLLVFGLSARAFREGKPRYWFAVGLACAAALLNKLPYGTWFLAVNGGWLAWGGSRHRHGRLSLAALWVGFASILAAYVALFSGLSGAAITTGFLWNLATHSQRYGFGPVGLPTREALWSNATIILTTAPATCLCLAVGLVMGVRVARKTVSDDPALRPLLVSLFLAALTALLLLLKHLQWYYLTFLAVLIPPIYAVLAPYLSGTARKGLTITTLLGVAYSGNAFLALPQTAPPVTKTEVTEASGRVLWGYRSFGPVALKGRVALFAGTPQPLSFVFGPGEYFEPKFCKYAWGAAGRMTFAEAAWAVGVSGSGPGYRYPWEAWRESATPSDLAGGHYRLYRRRGWIPLADPTLWRYREKQPPPGWTAIEFNDGAWSSGKPGFGKLPEVDFPYQISSHLRYQSDSSELDFRPPWTRLVRTPLAGRDLFLRRTVTLSADQKEPFCLAVNHDGPLRIWINGRNLGTRLDGTGDGFAVWRLDPAEQQYLEVGENTIAVQSQGEGYVQVIPAQLLP